ncbi:MAG: T9SS type A sorting domain-containing protein, partial [Flavobacteriales bacterium]
MLTLFAGIYSADAQRYLEEVFDEVTVDSGRMYGENATVLLYQFTGEAVPEPLVMDVYEPEGDTATSRPLMLYFHTGNFLPTPANQSPSGTRTDSTTVEICERFAKMGYVVASCSYRLGWNPTAETQDDRVNTLINAAYRGVQDARTAVRWFRKNVAENGNEFGIDPTKVAMFGQGTGGYITLAAATLDDYSEVLIPKFFTDVDGMAVPMVIESINGDIYGTSVGVNPLDNDTLCYPNHVGYDSDFNACVNAGGAMGDISWLEDGDMPMISFQAPSDPFAPYNTGVLIVPGVNLPVVEVSGSGDVQAQVAIFGNNEVFANAGLTDPYTAAADLINGGNEGLYPILRPAGSEADSSPWDYWADDNPNNANGLMTNPDMSVMKAHTYIDTIQGYTAPRLACALALEGAVCVSSAPANDLCADAIDVSDLFGGELNTTQSSEMYSNVDATSSDDPADGYECFDDNNTDGNGGSPTLENTVWFSFVGDGTSYAVETTDCDGTAEFYQGDTQMAIYSGGCDDLTAVACNDDLSFAGQDYYSYNFIETEDGVEYFILVDGYNYSDFVDGEPATGDFCLDVTQTTVNVDESSLIGLSAFPNPATDILTLTADQKIDFATVYNVLGAQVSNTQINANRTDLNISSLEAGVYIVEVTSGTQVSTLRFIKK